MLSLNHLTHPHFPKANSACCPKFAHFFFRAFSLLWARCWEIEKCIFWNLCKANLCLESSSCASSGTASKSSSLAEFKSFDLEKSSLPGEMSLLAELFWAVSTLPHKKTWMWFSPSFVDYGNYGCWVAFVLKEQFQKCFWFASVHKFLSKPTAKLVNYLKLLDFIRLLPSV